MRPPHQLGQGLPPTADLLRVAAACSGGGVDYRPDGSTPVQLAVAPACERCRRYTPAAHTHCLEKVRPALGASGSHLCMHGQAIRATADGTLLAIAVARRAGDFAALVSGIGRLAAAPAASPPASPGLDLQPAAGAGPGLDPGTADPAGVVMDATLRSLVAAIDTKDPYTRGHSERVNIASNLLGGALGLDPVTRVDLHWASLLHDVGKIGAPDHILKKPGKLTPEEYEVMKKHSARGDEMLEPIGWLAGARRGVRHHHERVDGSGYPEGLSGEAIPLIARVIAVADTFDALTSRRPYRLERESAGALEVLAEAAGTQLDRELVEIFTENVDRVVDALLSSSLPPEGLAPAAGAAAAPSSRRQAA